MIVFHHAARSGLERLEDGNVMVFYDRFFAGGYIVLTEAVCHRKKGAREKRSATNSG